MKKTGEKFNRKRLQVGLLFLLCMSLSLSGCIQVKKKDVSVSVATATPESSVATKAPLVLVTAEPTEEPEEETEEETFEKGTLTKSTYKSAFIGIQFKSTGTYKLATEEELNQIYANGADVVFGDDEDTKNQALDQSTNYEMFAYEGTAGYPNMSIATEELVLSSITEDLYVAAMKKQFEKANLEVTVGATKEVEIAGETYLLAPCTSKLNGESYSQNMYLRKKEDRMILITLTYKKNQEAAAKKMLNLVQSYEK